MPRRPNLKPGDTYKDSDGYIKVLQPDHPRCNCRGYVLQHRILMEAKIGRLLDPKEEVHHKNEIRHDNRMSNLQLCSGKKEHSLIHRPPRVCKRCGEKHFARGFCHKHYCEWYRATVWWKAAKCEKCKKLMMPSSYKCKDGLQLCRECRWPNAKKRSHINRYGALRF